MWSWQVIGISGVYARPGTRRFSVALFSALRRLEPANLISGSGIMLADTKSSSPQRRKYSIGVDRHY
jgi:hypothetical protein